MQKLQLSIPEPCHENWHMMTPTQQGRFCNACAKEVVDFSMMTDTEVLNYFTGNTHEKICGRALPSQLDRTIDWAKEPKKRLFWYWNYIVMFFMFFSKANISKAQGGVKLKTELSPVKPVDEDISKGQIAIDSWILKGKVLDGGGNRASFASVRIKGKPTGISTDVNGEYSIKVESGTILVLSYVGCNSLEVVVGTQRMMTSSLQWNHNDIKGDVVVTVAGGVMRRNIGVDKKPASPKYSAIFRIKDDVSGLPIYRAKFTTVKRNIDGLNVALTDSSGKYKLEKINEKDHLFVKVEAAGYESSEFEISGKEFGNKKKEWEVLLKKQKIDTSVSMIVEKPSTVVSSEYGVKRRLVTCSINGTIKVINTEANNYSENKLNNNFKIFPNPAQKSSSINLSLKLKEAGQYHIQITDAAARVILQKQANAPVKEYTEQLRVDDRWSSGVYYINIFNNKNQLISKASFIVQ